MPTDTPSGFVPRWVKQWEPDILKREPVAWAAFRKTFSSGTYREWTVFLVGWRLAKREEREACLKYAEKIREYDSQTGDYYEAAATIADYIRSRGKGERPDSFLLNCEVEMRPDDPGPLFFQRGDMICCRLDGYKILPIEGGKGEK